MVEERHARMIPILRKFARAHALWGEYGERVPRRRQKGDPTALSSLVPAVYPSKEPEDIKAMRAVAVWDKAVPERVARNARPIALTHGTLLVHTSTTVWAQEIDLLKEQLLASIRRVAPHSGVRRIRARVGKLPPLAPSRKRERKPPPAVPVEELPELLARELAHVPDSDIRDAVTRAASVSLGRDRARSVAKRRGRG
jgi:hypothetical protein